MTMHASIINFYLFNSIKNHDKNNYLFIYLVYKMKMTFKS